MFSPLTEIKLIRKAKRFDKRSGFFTIGVPTIFVLFSILVGGTFIVDKQLAVKFERASSLRQRELTLKEEHDQMLSTLAKVVPTERLDNSVPFPKVKE
ncbi:hypothetical protein BgAZ_206000 [Babesia gibsoni]|uniref:Uncharacterized protein n=1 Tax=Babesia gibsoni TaxID=33632 RepID=A0AAD8LMR5_BABGI|nr:hypothetical protein BgAZ_206000 [Babesia gibsoni]